MCYSDIRFVTKDFRQRKSPKDIVKIFKKIRRSLNAFWTFTLSENVLYSLVDLLECPTRYMCIYYLLWYRNAFAYVFDWVFVNALFSVMNSLSIVYGSAEYLLLSRRMCPVFCIFNLRNKEDEFRSGELFSLIPWISFIVSNF